MLKIFVFTRNIFTSDIDGPQMINLGNLQNFSYFHICTGSPTTILKFSRDFCAHEPFLCCHWKEADRNIKSFVKFTHICDFFFSIYFSDKFIESNGADLHNFANRKISKTYDRFICDTFLTTNSLSQFI